MASIQADRENGFPWVDSLGEEIRREWKGADGLKHRFKACCRKCEVEDESKNDFAGFRYCSPPNRFRKTMSASDYWPINISVTFVFLFLQFHDWAN